MEKPETPTNLPAIRILSKPFVVTPKRLVAFRQNMAKARAVRNRPGSHQRSRYNAVKHGLFVRSLEETFELLDDDPQEFLAHVRLIERTFVPRSEIERRIVRGLGEALWRRLRLYRAQARWEADALKNILGSAPAFKRLDPDHTRVRGYAVMRVLMSQDRLFRRLFEFTGMVERQIRGLLRQRTGGRPDFKVITRETLKELRELDRQAAEERTYALLERGGPEVEKILDRFRPEWMRKRPRS